MTALSIQPPYPIFHESDGSPLENGFVYIGAANQDPVANPIAVYWDAALTIPAAQPIRTLNGYPSRNGTPARMYVGSDYSIRVNDSKGVTVYSAAAATERLSNVVVTGVDASEVNFLQAGANAQARTAQSKLRDVVSVKDFGAVGDGVADDTAEIQAALAAADGVYFPPGTYKITSTLNIKRGNRLYGDNFAITVLQFWDCDGVKSAAGVNVNVYENLSFESVSSGGVPDPKTRIGIWSNGASGNTNSWVTIRNCNLRGWATCVQLNYTWNSCIDNTNTVSCNYGVVLFGQSVNNAISNSRLVANTGTASIYLQSDGATLGEGLMVDNTLLAEGAFGITSNNGFLSLNVSNSIIDLITNVGIYGVDLRATTISGSWIFAANRCVEMAALGVPVDVKATLQGNHLTVTAASGRAVMVGANAQGVRVIGGSITNAGASSYSVYSDAAQTHVAEVTRYHGGSGVDVFFGGANCTLDGVQYGTFTPTIVPDGTAGVGTYTEQVGQFTRIGKRVDFTLRVTWTAHTGSGNMRVAGLPFASKSISGYAPSCSIYPVNLTYSGTLAAIVNTGASTIELRSASSGAGATPVALDTSGTLTISGSYETP